MDGMGDLDNAPMPPMGADNNGMGDPMGGGQDPMADPMGGDPNDAGGTDPMGGEQPPMGGGDSDDDELMSIVDGMSAEDKAAVIKYAKSMADDSQGAQDPNMGGEMPMESRRSFKSIIDETINDVLDSKDGTKRPEKRMAKQYEGMVNPFKSPF